MTDKKWEVVEDPYLNDLRKRHMSVVVFLVNGAKQFGHIESFDRYTILLRNGASQQIIYKHTVAGVMPTAKALGQTKPTAPVPESAPVRSAPARPAAPPVIIRKPSIRRKLGIADSGTGHKGHQG